ncbi:MAG: hypothetical protein ACOCUH_02865 [Bacteriovoracia bacterium]
MRIACTCEKCHTTFTATDEDLFIEFDFIEKKIRFYCTVKKCKHVNVFDFSDWQQKQKQSPLPSIGIV